MKHRKIHFMLLCCLLVSLLLFPICARADFGDFSGSEDYSFESSYESYDDYYSYDDDSDYYDNNYVSSTSWDDASDEEVLTTAAGIAFLVALWAAISAIRRRIKGKKAAKETSPQAIEPTQPKIMLENMDYYLDLDPGFNRTELEEKLANLYVQMQNCWTEQNIESLRPYFSDGLFAQMERQLAGHRAKGHINHIERIAVLGVNLMGYYQTGTEDHIAAQVRARIVDYVVDAEGNVISGDRNKEKIMTYEWDLARPSGQLTTSEEGMTDIHCPNCGAPLNINKSAKCPYCGSVVTVEEHDWVISAIRARFQRTNGKK